MTAVIWGPVVSAPHPDCIAEALGVLEAHGGHAGPHPEETMHCVLAAVQAWQERAAAEEREHARRRDDPLRLAEVKTILDRAGIRAHARVRNCLRCEDRYDVGGRER